MKLFKSSIITGLISFVAVFGMFATRAAAAQVKSNTGTVTLSYSISESLAITVAGSGAITGDPVAGPVTGPITVTGTYNLTPSTHAAGVKIAAFPQGGLAAAISGPVNIPASNLNSNFNSGTWTTTGCTNADPDAIAGAADLCSTPQVLLTQAQLTTTPSGTLPVSTFVFGLRGGTEPQVAGTYSGVINFIVYAP